MYVINDTPVKAAELGIYENSLLKIVESVLKSGRFINGPWAEKFAASWAQFNGAAECIPVASGSAALIATLNQIKFSSETGEEPRKVILPDYSFAATAFAVKEAGLEPVYVNVDRHGIMNWREAVKAMRDIKPLAVIPVHMYGQYGIIARPLLEETIVIEDACQAHGTGPLQGLAACYSFYPAKNLGAAGDAGAVVTNVPALANRIRAYINYGDFPGQKYVHSVPGNNLRMDEIQATILHHKLPYLMPDNMRRAALAKLYREQGIESLANPKLTNNWHLYPILVGEPEQFIQAMRERGIEVGRHYPYRLSEVVPGEFYGKPDGNAEKLANHVVTLPIGPHLLPQDIVRVATAVKTMTSQRDGLWV